MVDEQLNDIGGDGYIPPPPSTMNIFVDDLDMLDGLSEEQIGKVFSAVIHTFKTDEDIKSSLVDPSVRAAYHVISRGVENAKKKYSDKCIKNRENRLKTKKSENQELSLDDKMSSQYFIGNDGMRHPKPPR